MELSEGMQGNPDPLSPAGAAVFRVSTVEVFSWIEAAVEVPPHGAKGTRGGGGGGRAGEGLGLDRVQVGVESLRRGGQRHSQCHGGNGGVACVSLES